ncbi:3' terminal RNA ribose 2'-O-methyltransferase Hen1 [Nocardia arthritidis]|uniref:Small RNA 2'-O-methyltransferase n=1 Tax=Nocardia arthritidis TaxID=228602 RepID=A0A6G9YAI7_9NOCA|nr:3' terminal RNA ribose 2'-O-methyltransferase Hen1 [Nocardia arthritidis]QIS10178.1 3' terminal RNA ribose 2'-O-methyltransferase Hen1 [Nocardia arthritidis]
MLLTITCTPPEGAAWPATDLGFLLHKNPDRVQAFEQSYGTAHVVYPEATAARCTAALLLEVDPIRLVRGRARNTPDFSLGQYVNDRPYAASSLLSVAIGSVFRTALHGRCTQRPDLVGEPLPLRIELPAVPCKGGPEVAARMFGPLGWQVNSTALPLDPAFPEWGASHHLRLELTGALRLAEALSHLYVLLPVLDGAKHYWLAADEVDKLIRAGSGWLGEHPERAWITRRYLARRQSLVRTALARLAEVDEVEPEELGAVEVVEESDTVATGSDANGDSESTATASDVVADRTGPEHAEAVDAGNGDRPVSLAVTRRAAVLRALHDAGAHRVLDLGCGEGALLRDLLADKTFTEIVGVDVSMRALNIAKRRLRLDRMPERMRARLTLWQGALTYTDARLRGYDAAVLMEVIEHVDPPRLRALEYAVFGAAAPRSVLVTTPNAEHNARFETLPAGEFRHHDHRFEWSRTEFAAWAEQVAAAHGYTVRHEPIGPVDAELGPPTQMAIFAKTAAEEGTEK